MPQEIKMIPGIFQAGSTAVKMEIECRVTCNGTLDTISFHTDKTVISLPLKEVEEAVKKARKK